MSTPDANEAERAELRGAAQPAPEGRVPRRLFVAVAGALGAGYAGLLGYPVYRYLASPIETAALNAAVTEVTLPDAVNLPRASALIFRFGTKPALLIHHEDDTWTCFSAVCTHLGCTVQYQAAQRRIFCACHGGVYDPATGKPVAGPPPKALTAFRVEIQDGKLTVHRT